MKASTPSGYSVKDVIEDLRARVMGHEYEYVCYWTAELVCSNQAKRLTQLFVSLFAGHYLTRNVYFVEALADKLAAVERMKYSAGSRVVRHAMCQAALLLAHEHQSTLSFDKYRNSGISEASTAIVERPPMVSVDIPIDVNDPIAASRIATVFGHICELMHKSDFQSVASLVFGLVASDAAVIDSLWELLVHYTQHIHIHQQPCATDDSSGHHHGHQLEMRYVKAMQRLFYVASTKASKRERTNIVLACFFVLTKRKPLCCVGDAGRMERALLDVDVLYREVESRGGTAQSDPEPEPTKPQHAMEVSREVHAWTPEPPKKEKRRGGKREVHAPCDSAALERADILMYYTYKDDDIMKHTLSSAVTYTEPILKTVQIQRNR